MLCCSGCGAEALRQRHPLLVAISKREERGGLTVEDHVVQGCDGVREGFCKSRLLLFRVFAVLAAIEVVGDRVGERRERGEVACLRKAFKPIRRLIDCLNCTANA